MTAEEQAVATLSEWLSEGEDAGLPKLAALYLLATPPSDRALRGWQLWPGDFTSGEVQENEHEPQHL